MSTHQIAAPSCSSGSSPLASEARAGSPETLRRTILLRLLPSITDVAFLLPWYFVFVKQGGASALLRDAGTALHILTGNWIIAHRAVPYQDLFSFTKPQSPWCAWEWGWDVLAALIHRQFGLAGIVLAHCLLLSLLFVFVFRQLRHRTGHSLLAFGLTVLAVEASCFHWLARPHLLSWLFVAATMSLLERERRGDKRALWAIPPLVLLWVNFHGSFFIALTLLAAYGLGELLDAAIAGDDSSRRDSMIAAGRYAAAGVAALAASLVNPYGWTLHAHIVRYLFDSRQLDQINEFLSPDFHQPPAGAIELLLLLGVLAAVWSIAHRRWGEAIAILLWAHYALVSRRNVSVFALIACGAIGVALVEAGRLVSHIPVRSWFAHLIEGVVGFGGDIEALERVERIPWLAFGAVAVLAFLLGATVKPAAFQPEFDPHLFPVSAVTAIATGPAGRVFTTDQWGDYLLYRLYPKTRAFLDDRSDFYGADFDNVAIRIATAQSDWRALLGQFRVDTVMLGPKDPLNAVLKLSPEWRLTFEDPVALVFRRSTPLSADQSPVRGEGVGRKASDIQEIHRMAGF